MMKKLLVFLLCLCLFIPCLAACATPANTDQPVNSTAPSAAPQQSDEGKDTTPIYIGVSVPLTGAGAEGGQKQHRSAEIAAKYINDNGGINGRPIELVVLDDAQDAAQAATVAQTLCDDERITAVIAHSSSAISSVTQPIFEENKMPNVSPSSSVDALSTYGYQYWWRQCAKSSKDMPYQFGLVVNHIKAQHLALIYQNTEVGNEIALVAKELESQGKFEVVLSEPFNSGTEVDFTTLVTKMMQTEADALLFQGSYTEGGTLLKQMLDMGCDLPVVSGSWMTYQTTIDLATAEGCKNLYCSVYPSPFGESDVHQYYIKEFEAIFGAGAIPNGPALCSFDSVIVIAEALRQGATRENLVDWICNRNNVHEGTFTVDGLLAGDGVTYLEEGEMAEAKFSSVRVNADGHFYWDGYIDVSGVEIAEGVI